ncbi:hypothetical protein HHX47_DHR4000455, partial [Lentinula edodes]
RCVLEGKLTPPLAEKPWPLFQGSLLHFLQVKKSCAFSEPHPPSISVYQSVAEVDVEGDRHDEDKVIELYAPNKVNAVLPSTISSRPKGSEKLLF